MDVVLSLEEVFHSVGVTLPPVSLPHALASMTVVLAILLGIVSHLLRRGSRGKRGVVPPSCVARKKEGKKNSNVSADKKHIINLDDSVRHNAQETEEHAPTQSASPAVSSAVESASASTVACECDADGSDGDAADTSPHPTPSEDSITSEESETTRLANAFQAQAAAMSLQHSPSCESEFDDEGVLAQESAVCSSLIQKLESVKALGGPDRSPLPSHTLLHIRETVKTLQLGDSAQSPLMTPRGIF